MMDIQIFRKSFGTNIAAGFTIRVLAGDQSEFAHGGPVTERPVLNQSIHGGEQHSGCARGSALFLAPIDGCNLGHPGLRRAEPDLPPRHELIALAQDADAHHIGGLLAFPRTG